MNDMLHELSTHELRSALKTKIDALEQRIKALEDDIHLPLEHRQRSIGILQHKLLCAQTRLRLLDGAHMPELKTVWFPLYF